MFQNTHIELVRLLLAFWLLGIGMGLLYDGFRIARVALALGRLPKPILWMLHFCGDLCYFALAGVITALAGYLLNRGWIRADLLLAEGTGFLCYYFTVGRVVYSLAGRLVAIVHRGIRFLWRHTVRPYQRLLAEGFLALRLAAMEKRLRRASAQLEAYYREEIPAALELPPEDLGGS